MIRIHQLVRRNSRKADRGVARAAGVVATSLFAKFRESRSDLRSVSSPAFTLVEMLIVVALIATLMTIVFRLGNVGSQDTAKSVTVLRLAKLENCLSGFYAAYGNYPPVRLHNSRDIYQAADGHGVQSSGNKGQNPLSWNEIGDSDEYRAWEQVKAACYAQPVGAEFPFPSSDDYAKDIQEMVKTLQKNLSSGKFSHYPKPGTLSYNAVNAGFDSLGSNIGRFSGKEDSVSWRDIQLFKFGLMSFLLPRYELMMGGDEKLYKFAQWRANNPKPPQNPMSGKAFADDGRGATADQANWEKIHDIFMDVYESNSGQNIQKLAQLDNIPADAVCARWLPNLSGICAGTSQSSTFFGVEVLDGDSATSRLLSPSDDPDSSFPTLHFYSPDGDSTADQYILDAITVHDGWGRELFYYSPSPHQSYQLWSAGKNGRTFPPWISRKNLSSKENECVYKWTHDDIKGMNN